ncbi:hypothetical protein TRFO_29791 [Tritrichomonas foetus]|uniref:Uncharacterized protein n=1 Tax=Tritrichomonas foetus TaxID=1144522 RepID=A0A1J4JUY2_9EUKA|nr:hypothetical protein TRFO_29791 [Tritrichomonas foetus]|eukprot:OHT02967.1 hypothetical protein TRFO_29791 [Tritrichomonas foetus]
MEIPIHVEWIRAFLVDQLHAFSSRSHRSRMISPEVFSSLSSNRSLLFSSSMQPFFNHDLYSLAISAINPEYDLHNSSFLSIRSFLSNNIPNVNFSIEELESKRNNSSDAFDKLASCIMYYYLINTVQPSEIDSSVHGNDYDAYESAFEKWVTNNAGSNKDLFRTDFFYDIGTAQSVSTLLSKVRPDLIRIDNVVYGPTISQNDILTNWRETEVALIVLGIRKPEIAEMNDKLCLLCFLADLYKSTSPQFQKLTVKPIKNSKPTFLTEPDSISLHSSTPYSCLQRIDMLLDKINQITGDVTETPKPPPAPLFKPVLIISSVIQPPVEKEVPKDNKKNKLTNKNDMIQDYNTNHTNKNNHMKHQIKKPKIITTPEFETELQIIRHDKKPFHNKEDPLDNDSLDDSILEAKKIPQKILKIKKAAQLPIPPPINKERPRDTMPDSEQKLIFQKVKKLLNKDEIEDIEDTEDNDKKKNILLSPIKSKKKIQSKRNAEGELFSKFQLAEQLKASRLKVASKTKKGPKHRQKQYESSDNEDYEYEYEINKIPRKKNRRNAQRHRYTNSYDYDEYEYDDLRSPDVRNKNRKRHDNLPDHKLDNHKKAITRFDNENRQINRKSDREKVKSKIKKAKPLEIEDDEYDEPKIASKHLDNNTYNKKYSPRKNQFMNSPSPQKPKKDVGGSYYENYQKRQKLLNQHTQNIKSKAKSKENENNKKDISQSDHQTKRINKEERKKSPVKISPPVVFNVSPKKSMIPIKNHPPKSAFNDLIDENEDEEIRKKHSFYQKIVDGTNQKDVLGEQNSDIIPKPKDIDHSNKIMKNNKHSNNAISNIINEHVEKKMPLSSEISSKIGNEDNFQTISYSGSENDANPSPHLFGQSSSLRSFLEAEKKVNQAEQSYFSYLEEEEEDKKEYEKVELMAPNKTKLTNKPQSQNSQECKMNSCINDFSSSKMPSDISVDDSIFSSNHSVESLNSTNSTSLQSKHLKSSNLSQKSNKSSTVTKSQSHKSPSPNKSQQSLNQSPSSNRSSSPNQSQSSNVSQSFSKKKYRPPDQRKGLARFFEQQKKLKEKEKKPRFENKSPNSTKKVNDPINSFDFLPSLKSSDSDSFGEDPLLALGKAGISSSEVNANASSTYNDTKSKDDIKNSLNDNHHSSSLNISIDDNSNKKSNNYSSSLIAEENCKKERTQSSSSLHFKDTVAIGNNDGSNTTLNKNNSKINDKENISPLKSESNLTNFLESEGSDILFSEDSESNTTKSDDSNMNSRSEVKSSKMNNDASTIKGRSEKNEESSSSIFSFPGEDSDKENTSVSNNETSDETEEEYSVENKEKQQIEHEEEQQTDDEEEQQVEVVDTCTSKNSTENDSESSNNSSPDSHRKETAIFSHSSTRQSQNSTSKSMENSCNSHSISTNSRTLSSNSNTFDKSKADSQSISNMDNNVIKLEKITSSNSFQDDSVADDSTNVLSDGIINSNENKVKTQEELSLSLGLSINTQSEKNDKQTNSFYNNNNNSEKSQSNAENDQNENSLKNSFNENNKTSQHSPKQSDDKTSVSSNDSRSLLHLTVSSSGITPDFVREPKSPTVILTKLPDVNIPITSQTQPSTSLKNITSPLPNPKGPTVITNASLNPIGNTIIDQEHSINSITVNSSIKDDHSLDNVSKLSIQSQINPAPPQLSLSQSINNNHKNNTSIQKINLSQNNKNDEKKSDNSIIAPDNFDEELSIFQKSVLDTPVKTPPKNSQKTVYDSMNLKISLDSEDEISAIAPKHSSESSTPRKKLSVAASESVDSLHFSCDEIDVVNEDKVEKGENKSLANNEDDNHSSDLDSLDREDLFNSVMTIPSDSVRSSKNSGVSSSLRDSIRNSEYNNLRDSGSNILRNSGNSENVLNGLSLNTQNLPDFETSSKLSISSKNQDTQETKIDYNEKSNNETISQNKELSDLKIDTKKLPSFESTSINDFENKNDIQISDEIILSDEDFEVNNDQNQDKEEDKGNEKNMDRSNDESSLKFTNSVSLGLSSSNPLNSQNKTSLSSVTQSVRSSVSYKKMISSTTSSIMESSSIPPANSATSSMSLSSSKKLTLNDNNDTTITEKTEFGPPKFIDSDKIEIKPSQIGNVHPNEIENVRKSPIKNTPQESQRVTFDPSFIKPRQSIQPPMPMFKPVPPSPKLPQPPLTDEDKEMINDYLHDAHGEHKNIYQSLSGLEEKALVTILPRALQMSQHEVYDAISQEMNIARNDPIAHRIVTNITTFLGRDVEKDNPLSKTSAISLPSLSVNSQDQEEEDDDGDYF